MQFIPNHLQDQDFLFLNMSINILKQIRNIRSLLYFTNDGGIAMSFLWYSKITIHDKRLFELGELMNAYEYNMKRNPCKWLQWEDFLLCISLCLFLPHATLSFLKSQILCHYLAYLPFGDILIFYVCVKLRPYILTFQALYFLFEMKWTLFEVNQILSRCVSPKLLQCHLQFTMYMHAT